MNAEQLKNRDYVILLDKSTSMNENDGQSQTRWQRAQEWVNGLATEMVKHDPDGITVIPFASNHTVYQNVTSNEIVKKIFTEVSPNGSTATGKVFAAVLGDWAKTRGTEAFRPLTVVCITDGDASDREVLKKAIIDCANTMEADEECGILFAQIGSDPKAAELLNFLDNGLQSAGAKFDIVDCKTQAELEDISLVDALLEAVND